MSIVLVSYSFTPSSFLKSVFLFSLREKCPNTEFFLAYVQENMEQKKLRIWTLFMQCLLSLKTCFFLKFYFHVIFSSFTMILLLHIKMLCYLPWKFQIDVHFELFWCYKSFIWTHLTKRYNDHNLTSREVFINLDVM